jgi:hypothetical protein
MLLSARAVAPLDPPALTAAGPTGSTGADCGGGQFEGDIASAGPANARVKQPATSSTMTKVGQLVNRLKAFTSQI